MANKTVLFALIVAISYFNNASAQVKAKIDTVYYLLDTNKTPVNDRMWEIGIELPFKHYVINCPCLAYNQKPAFLHPVTDIGEIITNRSLKKLKLSSITALIEKSKNFIERGFKGYKFFLIAPVKNKFLVHKVGLAPPMKSTPTI